MGLSKGGWKNILRQRYPQCFQKDSSNLRPNVVIEEGGMLKFSLIHAAKKGADIEFRLRKRVLNAFRKGATRYYYLLDSDPPKNKGFVQAQRRKNKEMYTDEDLHRMSALLPISLGEIPNNSEKILFTPALCSDFYRFLTQSLLTTTMGALIHHANRFESVSASECNQLEQQFRDNEIFVYDGRLADPLWQKNPVDKTSRGVLPPNSLIHAKKRLDSQEFETLTYYHIGEAELKIPSIIRDNLGKTILINCGDLDIVPILLLSMRDLFNPEGNVDTKIFIDLTTGHSRAKEKKKKLKTAEDEMEEDDESNNQVIDVVALWRSIIIDFKTRKIKLPPIETMCGLMTFGSDYVESIPNLSTQKLLDIFFANGHHIASQHGGLFETCGEDDWSLELKPRRIVVSEHNWLLLFGIGYTQKLCTDREVRAKPVLPWPEITALIEQDIKKKMVKTNKPGIWGKSDTSHLFLHSIVRRMYWLLDYWVNGAKCFFLDPAETDKRTGKSLYGWKDTLEGCFATTEIFIETAVNTNGVQQK